MSLFTKSAYEGGMSSVSRRQRRGDAWTTTRTVETALWILSAILFLLILLFCPDQAFGQAPNAVTVSFGPVISPYTTISANAPYRVCLASALGVPCSTAGVTIYSDINLTHVQSNPTFANSQGIVNFFTTSGFYQIQLNPVPGQLYTYYAFPSGGGSGGGLTIQTNSVNNFSQSLLNFVNGTGIFPTNPSGGIEQINCNTTAASGSIGCSFIPLFGSGSPTATCSAGNVSQEYYDLTPANSNPQIWICKQTATSYAWQELPNFSFPYPGAGVPLSSGASWLTSYQVQGTDSKLLSSGAVSSSVGSLLCVDAQGGATTGGCAIPPSVTFEHNGSATGINQMIWNANDTFPAAPAGNVNVTWQHDLATGSWSGYVPTGGGGTGCDIIGIGDTDVLSVHPSGTCYGSSHFTWDDATGNENLILGDFTSTTNAIESYQIGPNNNINNAAQDLDLFVFGYSNSMADTTGLAGAISQATLIGDANTIRASGTNAAAVQDVGAFGTQNTITASGANSIFGTYIMGVSNRVENSLSNVDDVEIVGNNNDVNGAPSTVQIFGHLNQAINVSFDNPLDVNQTIVGGQNLAMNTGGGSYSDYFETFGHENYLHDCWDCIAIGAGVEVATNNMMGIGESRVPELRFTNANVQRTPLQMALPAPINTAEGLTNLGIPAAATTTCSVAFTGGTGSGGTGQIYVSGSIGGIDHYQIQITNGGSYSVAPTGATLTGTSCPASITVHATLLSVQACSSSLEGSFASIKDSTTNALGTTITGGGTNHVFGYCDGTNWIVAAAAGSGGGGGVGPGTTGYLPEFLTATTIGNSPLDDSVTTASTITSTKAFAVAVTGGQGGTVDLTEGTAASATAGHDVLYADSTAHCIEYSANGGAFSCLGTGSGPGTYFTEAITCSGTSCTLTHSPSTFLNLARNGLVQRYTNDFTVSGTTLTLVVAAGTGDVFYAQYYY